MPTGYDSLNHASKWADSNADTPPEAWELVDDDARYYWNGSMSYPRVDHIGAQPLLATLRIAWEILTAPDSGNIYFQYDLAAGGQGFEDLGAVVGSGALAITDHETAAATFRFAMGSSGATAYLGLANNGVVAAREIETTFNSEYSTAADAETLADLRTRLLLRTGYSSQLSNLPPGVEAQFNDYLYTAQRFLYRRFKALQTERFFTYQLKPGERYYAFANNIDQASVDLDPRKITGVYLEDLNGRWYPLSRGISPSRYTLVNNQSWPDSFEARDVFEIFPAPQDYFKLRVKGQFGLQAFADDADYTTIDAEPVFLYALGLAKLQKGDADAGDPSKWTGYFGMARDHVLQIVAATHQGKRHIPAMRPAPPLPQPFLVGVDDW